MNKNCLFLLLLAIGTALLSSCTVLEQASVHDFQSGFYKLKSDTARKKVYLHVSEDTISAHPVSGKVTGTKPIFEMPYSAVTVPWLHSVKFIKKSVDIDLTAILFKYRFPQKKLPAELTTDFNTALYVGWRTDYYLFKQRKDPLNHFRQEMVNRGFDFGAFVGAGSTTVGPFSTDNMVSNEYSGMIAQTGIAGFLQSKVASFGIAAGFDYLLSNDRKYWIYNKKPWLGLIVGIALN
ncbi:hypothetical protein C7N43_36995 [Sphingobacteriales bacterium UPWRP_1]|nr:hypothetical protein B6N25_00445 [Sphingobacteriales bacterium TSM_CSS]PSJ71896.1 hypothetical protein C7N43_36995 [Sphingobacteriales bacterium UPWRP_1]